MYQKADKLQIIKPYSSISFVLNDFVRGSLQGSANIIILGTFLTKYSLAKLPM